MDANREHIYSEEFTNDFQGHMKELTGARSVPRVFFQGKFIGGGDDTV